MSAGERFTLLITASGLLFAMLCTVIGLLWRAGNNWGTVTTEVKHLAESVGQIAKDTNERLQWLERETGRARRR